MSRSRSTLSVPTNRTRTPQELNEPTPVHRNRVPGGGYVIREEPARTTRGAPYVVRLIRYPGPSYGVVAARKGGGGIAEYRAARAGNAAMVFELYLAGIFDLSTRLADLPGGVG